MQHFEYLLLNRKRLAETMLATVKQRIESGLDVSDNPAPALNKNYAKAKLSRGLQPVRNWTWTGGLLSNLRVAESIQPGIEFADSRYQDIAGRLNSKSEQFGLSPKDRAAMESKINQIAGRIKIA